MGSGEGVRSRQAKRYEGKDIPFNAAMPGGHVRDYCNFSTTGFERFKDKIDSSRLSTRSMDRLAKVSRTVADIVGSDSVEALHLDKAAEFVIGGMLRDRS